jgi:feruloyl-CoA synthase
MGLAPERVLFVQRAPYPHDEKTMRTITYGDFRTRIRRIGQALLNRKFSGNARLSCSSENDIEHPLLMRAPSMSVCPTCLSHAPDCLLMKDFARLAEIVKVVQPGLIYANKLGDSVTR